MHLKKWLAVGLSAVLTLIICTGCKECNPALSRLLADMLEGQYPNLKVELESDLEYALERSAYEGGTEEEIMAQMTNYLKLTGTIITFDELEDGQQGNHALDTVFQPGSDYNAAARNTLNQWAKVFSSLPSDGQYLINLAMIEENGGYYIAADVYVQKAGSSHSHDSDDNDDDNTDNEPSYTKDENPDSDGRTVYRIHKPEGLQDMLDENGGPTDVEILASHIIFDDNIGDIHLKNWVPIGGITMEGSGDSYFTGAFDGGSGNRIYLDNFDTDAFSSNGLNPYLYIGGLFGLVGSGATIENVDLTVNVHNIQRTYGMSFGGIAGVFQGKAIQNCNVTFTSTGLQIKSSGGGKGGNLAIGGIVGVCTDGDTISNCHVTGNVFADTDSDLAYSGGIVGGETSTTQIINCTVSGSVIARANEIAMAGGIVGWYMPFKDNGSDFSQNCWTAGSGIIQATVGDDTATATDTGTGIDMKGTASEEYQKLFTSAANAGTLIGYNFENDTPVAG